MNITYPHIIENCIGEKLIFQELQKESDGDRLLVENYVAPGSGPVMHTHWLQDESLTVINGDLDTKFKDNLKNMRRRAKQYCLKEICLTDFGMMARMYYTARAG